MPYPYTYFNPNKKEQMALGAGSLVAALLGAASGQNGGDAALRGLAGLTGGYGAGYQNYQNLMNDAFSRDINERRYSQGVREYEEVDKPYKEAFTKHLSVPNEKEFNIPGDLDSFLASRAGKYGLDYSNQQDRMKMLGLYGRQDTGLSRQFEKWKTDTAPQMYMIPPGYQSTGGEPLSYNMRKGKFSKKTDEIQKTPSEADVKFEREYTSADAILDNLEQEFKKNENALPNNAYERISEYPSRLLGRTFQTEAGVGLKNLQQLTDATKSKLIRALGEVGTLTDVDIQRVSSAMASINDVKAVRENAISQLRKLIGDIHSRGVRQSNILPNTKTAIEGKPKTAEEYLSKFK